MKFVFFFLSVLVFAVSISAQGDRSRIDFQIKGAGINSTYDDIVKSLGEPKRVVDLGEDECTGGVTKTLDYDGLQIKTDSDKEDKSKTSMTSVKITSRKWVLGSGIKLGDTKAAVRRRLGAEFKGSSPNQLVYDVLEKYGPGAVTFFFSRNKLVRIELSMTLC